MNFAIGGFDILFCQISHCNSLKKILKNSCNVGFDDIRGSYIPNRVKYCIKIKTKVLITMDRIRYLGISLGGRDVCVFRIFGIGPMGPRVSDAACRGWSG